MKKRLLFMKYMLMLRMPFRMFSLMHEFRYNYDLIADWDILVLMSSYLANRNGDWDAFNRDWGRRVRRFHDRSRVDRLELLFRSRIFKHG